MTTDSDLAAIELKQYTINLLNNIEKEVTAQFDKWVKPKVGFVDLLCTAFGDAANDQVAVLKDEQEEKRRAFERALFILNLCAIGATNWLGAAMELKLGPKIFFEYEANLGAVLMPKFMLKKIHNEFKGKIFGDMSKDLASLAVDLAGEHFNPSDGYREPNPNNVIYAPNAATFGQKIYVEADVQQTFVTKTINRIAQNINNSPTFGQALVARVLKRFPQCTRLGRVGIVNAGHALVNELFDMYRQNWAAQWYYYGYDPPSQPRWSNIRRHFERQIWAVWILQQHFSVQKMNVLNSYYINGASGPVLETSGGFGSLIKDSPIVTRLFEAFNVPVSDMILNGPPHSEDGCQAQIDKINKWAINEDQTVLRGELDGKKRVLGPVDQIW